MTSSVRTHQTNRAASLFGNLGFNATAATVAAVAAGASAALALPVWAMFISWIAFFTRGLSARDGAWNLISVLLGIAIGMAIRGRVRAARQRRPDWLAGWMVRSCPSAPNQPQVMRGFHSIKLKGKS